MCFYAPKGIVYNLGNYKRTIFQLISELIRVKSSFQVTQGPKSEYHRMLDITFEKYLRKKILIESKETAVI